MASVVYMITFTYASTTDSELALLAHWSVRQKIPASLVQFSSVTSLCALLNITATRSTAVNYLIRPKCYDV